MDPHERRRLIGWNLAIMLAGLGLYLVAAHYIKCYSDPASWLRRAAKLLEGTPDTERAPLYPFFLAATIKLVGPIYAFLSNLPLLLAMVLLSFGLTLRLVREEQHGGMSGTAGITAFVTVAWLVAFNHRHFLEILNPFREPLAFCLALGAAWLFVAGLDRRRLPMLGLAGALFGLSTGTRETTVLMLPSFLILGLYENRRRPGFPMFRSALVFAAGLLIGLSPMLIQNVRESGRIWMPSYMADDWKEHYSKPENKDAASAADGREGARDTEEEAALADQDGGQETGRRKEQILAWVRESRIPGMHERFFLRTGRRTLVYLRAKYGAWSWALALLGLILCFRRRAYRVILFYLTGGAIYLLFYACYHYVKERYVFAAELCLVPFMAIGAVAALRCVAAVLRALTRRRHPWLEWSVPGATLAVLAALACGYADKYNALQVWHVRALRQSVVPHLKRPYRFISKNHHYSQMLQWLLEGERIPVAYGSRIDSDLAREDLGHALSAESKTLLPDVAAHNIYACGGMPLMGYWFDMVPVLSLAEVPVPLKRYHKRVRKTLYEVRLWSATNVVRTVSLPQAERHALVVDCRRLWDYADRTFCRVYVNGSLMAERLDNGSNFLNLDPAVAPGGSRAAVRIVSDAPLPRETGVQVLKIGASMKFDLGVVATFAMDQYVSDSLRMGGPLNHDGYFLCKRGEIQLPCFAPTGRVVFADFRVNDYREDDFYRGEQTLWLESDLRRVDRPYPGWRQADWVGVVLGRGTDRLEMKPVRFESSMPSSGEQRRLRKQGIVQRSGFLKLIQVRLRPLPWTPQPKLDVDVGSNADGPYILGGFYRRERTRGKLTVRWTRDRARLVLPLRPGPAGSEFRIRCAVARPEPLRGIPAFRVQGREVPPDAVRVERPAEGLQEFVFIIPALELGDLRESTLEIAAQTWRPSEFIETKDTRSLGYMVDRVSVRPLE